MSTLSLTSSIIFVSSFAEIGLAGAESSLKAGDSMREALPDAANPLLIAALKASLTGERDSFGRAISVNGSGWGGARVSGEVKDGIGLRRDGEVGGGWQAIRSKE